MNILLTSVGRRSYLVHYFRQALEGRGKVISANMYADSPGMCAADESVLVPPSHHASYVDVIEKICRERHVGMLCSFHDLDVFVLAQAHGRLSAAGVIPVLPDSEWARICLDKYECGLRLQECGWQLPWTGTTLEQVKNALAAGKVAFPLMVKSRLGFGSLGVHRCENFSELERLHRQVRGELANGLAQQFLALPSAATVLIQEAIDGPEYCVDVVNDLRGRYATHFACEVHAMRSGESDRATTTDTALVGDLPVRLSAITRHPGIWGLDLIVDKGVPKIIDVNPRFTGDYPFQHLAGANIPAALLAWARDEEPKREWLQPTVGIKGYKDLVPMRVPARVPVE